MSVLKNGTVAPRSRKAVEITAGAPTAKAKAVGEAISKAASSGNKSSKEQAQRPAQMRSVFLAVTGTVIAAVVEDNMAMGASVPTAMRFS